jgi:peroxiredoxin Q/BCP
MLKVGDRAPDFEAVLDDGTTFRVADLRGQKHLVLYFYPKAFSGGCTAQACSFRDSYGPIRALDAVILGVSADAVESQHAFREKHSLEFPMASDADGSLRRAFDVTTSLPLLRPRVTYVIDKQGIVRGAFRHDILVNRHIVDALRVLRQIEGAPAA